MHNLYPLHRGNPFVLLDTSLNNITGSLIHVAPAGVSLFMHRWRSAPWFLNTRWLIVRLPGTAGPRGRLHL
jgi:hypothetical protein